ncbi:collagen-binding domain-containing protein [Eubacterium multiforme]|uniref:Choice-of-anchor A domain-containing protein n=1 Tax=Eubacterium multiforme TaxID=83339 RepID=A0ABT9UVE2_9FIRM|nr:collagen-binding domain-containing protein [Eubacterium multiforme]MDQ0150282.1 choice-of-anchor A domain-containing protein [Eubacterium multiforme]
MKKKRKSYRNILMSVVIITFLTFNMFPSIENANAEESSFNLGNLSHYNVIIFGNANVKNSRVEGALAVGGNINVSSGPREKFEICASASKGANISSSLVGSDYIEGNGPSLLLGGNVIKQSKTNNDLLVWSKPIVTNDSISNETKLMLSNTADGKQLKELNEKTIESEFANFKNSTNNFINNVKGLKIESEKASNLRFHGDNGGSYYKEVPIGNIVNSKSQDDIKGLYCNLSKNNENVLNISEIHLPDVIGSAKDNNIKYLVLYSDAKTVNLKGGGYFYNKNFLCSSTDESNDMIAFHNGNNTLKKLAEKIVWVLPNATNVNTDAGVIGTVVAPNATLKTNGGDIVGQVVVNNFNQENGGNFCNALFAWNNWTNVVENNGGKTPSNKDDNYENPSYDYNSNSLLNLNKTVNPVHKDNSKEQLNDRSYNVNLSVNAKPSSMEKREGQDIILVLDKSGSMRRGVDNYSISPFETLKTATKQFSKNMLNNDPSNTSIGIITFSTNQYVEIKYIDGAYYVKDKNGKNHEVEINDEEVRFIYRNSREKRELENLFGGTEFDLKHYGDGYYIEVYKRASNEDAELIQPFTNKYSDIDNAVSDLKAVGGTDTMSAMNMLGPTLDKVKNDGRKKYVIFFTDGLPNILPGQNFGDGSIYKSIDAVENKFDDLTYNYPEVKFISVGFKSSDSVKYKEETYSFLRYIQNYNTKVSSDGNNLIFANDPSEIESIYDNLANNIIKFNSITTDATIRDIIPYNLIPNVTPPPKGTELKAEYYGLSNLTPGYKLDAVPARDINGEIIKGKYCLEVYWDNQVIGYKQSNYKFTFKANNEYFGGNNVPGNEYADVTYTNEVNSDNNKLGQKFNLPTINVPNECSMDLNDKTVIYGDKVDLKDLIKNINIKYGPNSGYNYTWTDEGTGEKINAPNYGNRVFNPEDKSIENYETPFYMKDNDKFNLKITNNSLKDNPLYNELVKNLNKTSNITVLKPTITITKKLVDEKNNSINTNDKFAFNICGGILNQSWNMDIKGDSPFTINNVTRGVYKLNELKSQGYDLQSLKINGKEVNKDNLEFVITDASHESEDSSKYKNDPIIVVNKDNLNINIEITNKKIETNVYNDTNIKENSFATTSIIK